MCQNYPAPLPVGCFFTLLHLDLPGGWMHHDPLPSGCHSYPAPLSVGWFIQPYYLLAHQGSLIHPDLDPLPSRCQSYHTPLPAGGFLPFSSPYSSRWLVVSWSSFKWMPELSCSHSSRLVYLASSPSWSWSQLDTSWSFSKQMSRVFNFSYSSSRRVFLPSSSLCYSRWLDASWPSSKCTSEVWKGVFSQMLIKTFKKKYIIKKLKLVPKENLNFKKLGEKMYI